MTTIRVQPEELETVAKHVPDAEDACQSARTSLSWELSSLVIEITGIGSDAIYELKDELIHWLDRYEEKLNEAEELLYRTAAAIRQADQTLADNMKEFGLELLGWYDLQRLFGEYDPITGERISAGDRLLAGGMLLLTIIPPAKGAGIAGKVAVKGAKAAETAADVSKLVSQMKYVLRYDKIMPAFQVVYHQVVKAPITKTLQYFKKQWNDLLASVPSVQWQPALAGIGPEPRIWMSGAEKEVKETTMNMIGKTRGEVVGKGTGNTELGKITGYKFKEDVDLDFRGTGKTYRDALNEAFIRTGVPRTEFTVTKWGRDANGKSFPVEWRAKNGAEVNIDIGHTKNGPDVPHIGYQTGGKRGGGGAIRGHILVDDVPVNR
ncbi:polymorphic toxin type 47 domain-containing protein [Thermaerobacillus caldiproteolyticus]|uniref:Uncharacterized protein YukE n=1 Tax=Thermaerobacillus caldiproteolyticus TaxID=247480 RepID=A0A7W0BYH4_9BACL|nr:polymorphic toxin type 47 domain-containing protein [Anoxybacillus caldiproteolyticus]MBA2874570.1 uncharacterized protein YukE [Anoxybacillus caldiproteolyticus]